MKRDPLTGKKASDSLTIAQRTAAANGTVVDRQGFFSALIVLIATVFTGGTHTLKVQESDATGSGTFTDVPVDDLVWDSTDASIDATGALIVDAAGDVGVHMVGYVGTKRYLRVVRTGTGDAVSGGIIIADHPRFAGVTLL